VRPRTVRNDLVLANVFMTNVPGAAERPATYKYWFDDSGSREKAHGGDFWRAPASAFLSFSNPRRMSRPTRIEPGPGQESVWDYPRPPRVERVLKRLRVVFAGKTIADTRDGARVIETAGAPVYFFPRADVDMSCLSPTPHTTLCEWKGRASYLDVIVGDRRAERAAFTYPDPPERYESIRDWIAFYASPMDACFVGEERAEPQPGGFYAGWVTSDIVGPIKGEPGSGGW